jgi:hypothetical protein
MILAEIEFDLIEINAMIISLIAIINFPLIIKKRKDFIKYLPGLIFLMMIFIFGFLDDLFEFNGFEIFEILESACILAAAILLLLASLIELHNIFLKWKASRIHEFNQKKLNVN